MWCFPEKMLPFCSRWAWLCGRTAPWICPCIPTPVPCSSAFHPRASRRSEKSVSPREEHPAQHVSARLGPKQSHTRIILSVCPGASKSGLLYSAPGLEVLGICTALQDQSPALPAVWDRFVELVTGRTRRTRSFRSEQRRAKRRVGVVKCCQVKSEASVAWEILLMYQHQTLQVFSGGFGRQSRR